jgi:hypothetical protein
MSTFPALTPSTRTYTPGSSPNTPLMVLTGNEVSVRHSSSSVGHRLRMSFNLLSRADHFSLISHYALHGRFDAFDLDAATLVASGLTFPTGYQWIYVSPPETEEVCGEIYASVEMELVAPSSELADVSTCPTADNANSGGTGTYTKTIDIGSGAGSFELTYDFFNIADRIVITGAANYDSGIISGLHTVTITKATTDRYITLTIYAPTSGTQWEYTVGCTE